MVLVLALVAFGCTSSCPSCPTRVELRCPTPETCPEPARVAAPADPPSRPERPPEAWSLARLSEDLNDDGTPEVIELFSDGRLEFLGHSFQFTLSHEATR